MIFGDVDIILVMRGISDQSSHVRFRFFRSCHSFRSSPMIQKPYQSVALSYYLALHALFALEKLNYTSMLAVPAIIDISSNPSLPNINTGPLQCRICMQESFSLSDLITPCNCRGTMRFVHPSCMAMWIANCPAHRIHNHRICCELCKHPIMFMSRPRTRCRSKQEANRAIGRDKHRFMGLILAVVFLILAEVAGIGFTTKMLRDRQKDSLVIEGSVLLVGIVCIAALIGLALYFIAKLYLLKPCQQVTIVPQPTHNHSFLQQNQSIQERQGQQRTQATLD